MGLVTIGASPLTAGKVLPAAVANVISRHPSLTVRIVTVAADLIEGLLAGQYDFVVKVLGHESERDIARKPLFKDRLLIVSRRGHPLARRRRVLPRHLTEFDWVLPPPGKLHRSSLEQFFIAEGLAAPRVAVECSNTDVIVNVVRRTDSLGIVAGIAQRDAPSEGLHALSFASPFFIRTVGVNWRRAGKLSPAAQMVMREIESGYEPPSRAGRSR
jgi:LysR family transcriptional regulator of gallate degradation